MYKSQLSIPPSQTHQNPPTNSSTLTNAPNSNATIPLAPTTSLLKVPLHPGVLNVIGETHPISGVRRPDEALFCDRQAQLKPYYKEAEMPVDTADPTKGEGDPFLFRFGFVLQGLASYAADYSFEADKYVGSDPGGFHNRASTRFEEIRWRADYLSTLLSEWDAKRTGQEFDAVNSKAFMDELKALVADLQVYVLALKAVLAKEESEHASSGTWNVVAALHQNSVGPMSSRAVSTRNSMKKQSGVHPSGQKFVPLDKAGTALARSKAMDYTATLNAGRAVAWKIGNEHAKHILAMGTRSYTLILEADFEAAYQAWIQAGRP